MLVSGSAISLVSAAGPGASQRGIRGAVASLDDHIVERSREVAVQVGLADMNAMEAGVVDRARRQADADGARAMPGRELPDKGQVEPVSDDQRGRRALEELLPE